MKYLGLFVLMVFFLLGSMGQALVAADMSTDTPPDAVFPQVTYEFEKVVDGTVVTHNFAVKNTGKGVLEISRVKTG
ncbi:uncharacterized protein Dvar_23970 [Desulfosarcina variabilis str. Montpellier]